MLSDYILTERKLVLIKDQLGIDKNAKKIVTSWLRDDSKLNVEPKVVKSLNEQDRMLLAPISKLSRHNSPSELFKFVKRCKRNDRIQFLFMWATEKNICEHFLVPYLEHQSEMIVTIEDDRYISLCIKRYGPVTHKRFNYQVREGRFAVKELKHDRTSMTSAVKPPTIDPASLGTFKIGNLNKEEKQAKEALTLPFEFFRTTAGGGRVLYHPDAQDDLDEEDPDDDLMI